MTLDARIENAPDFGLDELEDALTLDALLARVAGPEGYALAHHWTQGEFHHDVVLELAGRSPAPVLVVATNCNGGVKEVLAFDAVPSRDALWHARVPENPEFATDPLPALRGRLRTTHFFDPRELLAPDARSELKPEHRSRQRGGGWVPREP
ncbi:MAG: hypothetical protein AAGH15_06165 [Myxococcota bacterium]